MGGDGGNAKAAGGDKGNINILGNSINGKASAVGGNGGNGGDGCIEGFGGSGGAGNPSGKKGIDGKNICEKKIETGKTEEIPLVCGDNIVAPPEQCDPIGSKSACDGMKIKACGEFCRWMAEKCDKTECQAICQAGETKCSGTKIMSCDTNICDWDNKPICLKGNCGAACAVGADCLETQTCNLETCECETKISVPNQEPVIEDILVVQLHLNYDDVPHKYFLTALDSDPDENFPLTYAWSIDCGYFVGGSASNSVEWHYDIPGECINAQATVTVTDSLGASATFSKNLFE